MTVVDADGAAHRAAVRAELSTITPLDALERQHRDQALAWVDAGAELCRRIKPATPPMHLVSYFVLVDQAHLLLVDHRNAQLWLPAGGHVDAGEHPRRTVQREVAEELGLRLVEPPGAPLLLTITPTVGLTVGHTDVSLWYVLPVPRSQPLQWDRGEFVDLRWFAFDQLPLDRCDPHLPRFVAKLRG